MSKRNEFSSAFKYRVVIEAIKEQRTLSELGQKYSLSAQVIANWKKDFLEKSVDIFDKPDSKKKEHEHHEDELYKEIGKLKVENEFLKKNLAPYL